MAIKAIDWHKARMGHGEGCLCELCRQMAKPLPPLVDEDVAVLQQIRPAAYRSNLSEKEREQLKAKLDELYGRRMDRDLGTLGVDPVDDLGLSIGWRMFGQAVWAFAILVIILAIAAGLSMLFTGQPWVDGFWTWLLFTVLP